MLDSSSAIAVVTITLGGIVFVSLMIYLLVTGGFDSNQKGDDK